MGGGAVEEIKLVEVGPRDGFQNVCDFIPTEIKLNIIDKIAQAGVRNIMITSFVSPRAIPQMRDAREVAGVCLERYPSLHLSALVPNLRGAQDALAAGIRELAIVISVSEAHNRANVNRAPAESFAELGRIVDRCPEARITLDLATAFGCPFTGQIPLEQVQAAAQQGYDLGIRSMTLCDTIGAAHPAQVRRYVRALLEQFPDVEFGVHIHDTRNMGMVNTLAAIECGITSVQAALGGLGGCPFAPGASGNTSSEDLVYMLNHMGYRTGVEEQKLLEAARYAHAHIQGNFSGHQIKIAPDKTTMF